MPAGLAEVWVQDAAGARIGALPAAGDDEITLTCQDGPQLLIGDREVRTRLTTTRAELLRGHAIEAQPCDRAPIPMAAGPVEVSVAPGEAFTVDTVGLVVVDSTNVAPGAGAPTPTRAPALGGVSQPTRAVTTVRWDPSRRELHVPAGTRERVLVVPESVSPAWRARLVADDGSGATDPRPVTVDGWKQGWVLPASDVGATLVLTVPLDGPYRVALLTGPFALLLVLVLFLLRGHDRAGARASAWRARGPVTVAATALVAFVLAGPVGLGLAAGVTAGALAASRYLGAGRARELLIAGSATGVVVGATLLARAPWPDPLGYAGDGWAPQVATVAGLVCAGLAAAWPATGGPGVTASAGGASAGGAGAVGAAGRRRGANNRRDGSSTSA